MSAHWELRHLGDVIQVASGLVDPNAKPYSGQPHVGSDNIESHTGKLGMLKRSKDLGLISGKYAFGKEHVLYSKIRPLLNKVAVPEFEGICSADMYPLKPKNGSITREFLAHLLRSDEFRGYALKHSSRTNIPKLNRRALLAYSFSLPPLDEQKRIAGILDAADALRAKRREALAQLDALLQSTFLDMFGDPVTNPMGWEVEKLGAVGEVITGNTPPRSQPEYYGDHIEWIKSDNINDPSFFLTEAEERLSVAGKKVARTAPEGSILVTCIAGSPSAIGNAAIANREVAFNQQINAFVPGRLINYRFAFGLFWLGKRLVQRASTNSMKGMVNKSAFSAVSVPVPPRSLQDRFAAIVKSVEQQKASQRAHLYELDTLFASLQSRAFRGEL